MNKNADAFRTISEVADELDLPQHVLRFWETRFPQIKPLKRAGGRRYYRPRDIEVLRAIKHLLYQEGYTIRGVQRVLKDQIAGAVAAVTEAADGSFPIQARANRRFPRTCCTTRAKELKTAPGRITPPPGNRRPTSPACRIETDLCRLWP